MGKKSPPKPDKRIGEAAVMSAKIGQDYLAFMKDQAAITNDWAATDRARYQETFVPLENAMIAEAQAYDTPEARASAATEAVADVRQQAAIARAGAERRSMAMGVTPDSGRYAGETRRGATSEALASAGAGNMARRQVEETGRSLRAGAVNLGRGFAINPATSMGLSNGAASSGFSGAMQGQAQMGSLLNTQYQQQMQGYQAKQSALGGLGSALGSAFGATNGFGMLGPMALASSKDMKTDKKPVMGILDAVKEMPVEKWTYKDGAGDGKTHIGPYAEDFQAKTGLGDGKSISVIDALGVTMGAVKELAQKVDGMSGKRQGVRVAA